MTAFTIQLTDEQVERLVQRANEAGLEPDRLLQAEVDALFDRKRLRLRSMIQDVVRDNRELYERLA